MAMTMDGQSPFAPCDSARRHIGTLSQLMMTRWAYNLKVARLSTALIQHDKGLLGYI